MYRFTSGDIARIERGIADCDKEFFDATGKTMLNAVRFDFPFFASLSDIRAAVIPITSGLGVVNGFSQGVRTILAHAGCDTFVTAATDVAGLSEAYRRGADIAFLADDNEYAAYSLSSRAISVNGEATGIAFSRALSLAAEGMFCKDVLVLGLGAMGQAAAKHLLSQGARVFVYDTNESLLASVTANNPGLRSAPDWKANSYMHILDATPAANILSIENLKRDAILSSPGIPLGADAALLDMCEAVIANPLELGTIAMLAQVLYLSEL